MERDVPVEGNDGVEGRVDWEGGVPVPTIVSSASKMQVRTLEGDGGN